MKISPVGDFLVPLYAIGVIGALVQITGGFWDISWHVLGLVETFFTAPHSVLYSGILLSLLAGILALLRGSRALRKGETSRRLLTGLRVALVGSAMQLVAGPFDFWWHDNFGFDPFLFTPPHSLLIMGIILSGTGMSIGTVRLLQAYLANVTLGRFHASARWLQLLVVLALTSLFMDLVLFGFFITDPVGLAYTLQLCAPREILSIPNECGFVDQIRAPIAVSRALLWATTGTLVFFTAKSVLGWRGAVTVVGLLSAAIMVATRFGFISVVLSAGEAPGSIYIPNPSRSTGIALTSVIPLYFSFIIPVFLFDILVRNPDHRLRTIMAMVIISPFASELARAFALGGLNPILIVPTPLGGLIAGLLARRFVNALSGSSHGSDSDRPSVSGVGHGR